MQANGENPALCVLCLQEILSQNLNSLYTSIQNVVMGDLLWKNPAGQKVIQKSKVIQVQESLMLQRDESHTNNLLSSQVFLLYVVQIAFSAEHVA